MGTVRHGYAPLTREQKTRSMRECLFAGLLLRQLQVSIVWDRNVLGAERFTVCS